MACLVCLAAQQFCTRGHIAPLIRTADLQGYIVLVIEFVEIVALHDLVGELGVGNPCFNPLFDRFLAHHVVDGEVFSNITQEVDKANP